jgi:uncharacterized protein (TIGR03067 family)
MFAVMLSFVINADAKDDAVKKDLAALEGEWTIVSAERDGMKLPDELLKNSKRTAKGNESSVIVGGQLFMKATVAVDPSKKPKTIDYDVTDGPNKGKKQFGIYEIDGDTVKFCFAAPGNDRPTEFSSKERSNRILSVWKREKK